MDLRHGLTPEGLDLLMWGIRGKKPRAHPPPPGGGVKKADPDARDIDAYRTWALDRYRGMSLIGLGAAEIRVRFEEVYVPLRIAGRPGLGALMASAESAHGRISVERDDMDVKDIFSLGPPHALVLGRPGAGKTTALLKLLHASFAVGANLRGLARGTVPVLARLRRWSPGDLDLQLPELLGRELAEVSGGMVPEDLGPRLWERGRLLLLLDGLDEVGDEKLRARVCEYLDWALTDAERRHIRAVISCRSAGYGSPAREGERAPGTEVRFGEHVLPLVLQPLGAEQCRRLVRQWFP